MRGVLFGLVMYLCAGAAGAQTRYPAISTLFGAATPALPDATDNQPYTLGTVFQPLVNGRIDQIRFYKAPSETGTHVGRIWAYDTRTVLATVSFTNETAVGWQQAALAAPLPVVAGRRYVATVDINSHYADTHEALAGPVASGYLATPPGVAAGVYDAPGTFPTSSFESSNYFVDVAFHVTATLLTTQMPAVMAASDGVPYELGTRFQPTADCVIEAIRAWRSPGETGAHIGRLWTDGGQLLATTAFANETPSGWQTAMLSPPVAVHGGAVYVVSANINQLYPDTVGGLAAPGIAGPWLSTVTTANSGVFGAPGVFPTQSYQMSDYFRDVVFAPAAAASTAVPPLAPFVHRGWLGWIRDLASVPAPADAYWPYLAIDAQLIADYDFAGSTIAEAGANEIEIWGLAAGGYTGSPGYAVDVEQTASAARVAQIRQIIDGLHAKGLKVVAGTGGMSWGFDQIVAANPSIGCPNSPFVANPFLPLSWSYQDRIIDYLMSLGVDGITVQSGDQGRCDVAEGGPYSDVAYHARIVDQFANYVRERHPGAITGSANYGISFANPSDLPYFRQFTRHLDYVNDVVGGIDPTYRIRLIRRIAPALFGTEAGPSGAGSLVHQGPESFFVPTAQHDMSGLGDNYAAGDRANENYMRVLANPGDEVSGRLVLMYEANPNSDWMANLDSVLNELYQPQSAAALAMLRDLMLSGENAYFGNAYYASLTIEVFYNHNDTGLPFLRDNMSAAGRQAYRATLLSLRDEATAVLPLVSGGGTARVQSILRCIANTIAEIDALPSS